MNNNFTTTQTLELTKKKKKKDGVQLSDTAPSPVRVSQPVSLQQVEPTQSLNLKQMEAAVWEESEVMWLWRTHLQIQGITNASDANWHKL